MILEEPIKGVPLVKNYIDGEWVECKKGNSLLQAAGPVFPQFLQVNFGSIY